MGAGAHVSGASLAAQLRRRLDRYYPFEAQPGVTRNTISPAAVVVFDRPGLNVVAAGGGAGIANRIYEFYVERNNIDVFIEGPDSSDPWNYPLEFMCQYWGASLGADPGPTAYAGIQLYGNEANPPFSATPANAMAQLRQRLHTPTTWELMTAPGGGGAAETTVVTGLQSDGTGSGHHIGLVVDPISRTVSAIVDGRVIAQHGTASYPDPNLSASVVQYVGGFLTTGTLSNAYNLFGNWAAFRCSQLGTGAPGFAL
jgi:hypothetical protein